VTIFGHFAQFLVMGNGAARARGGSRPGVCVQ